jgi:hypothetical protein
VCEGDGGENVLIVNFSKEHVFATVFHNMINGEKAS